MRLRLLSVLAVLSATMIATPAAAQMASPYGNPACGRFICGAPGNAGTGPAGGYVTDDGRHYYRSGGPPPNPYVYGTPYGYSYGQPYYGRQHRDERRSDESVAKSTIAGALVGALIGFAVAGR
ncbi:MAG TPA: hypothetical protein VFY28_02040 [Candidatus Paceibacterota bacterium]|nr:hypothetical protein [Candidatus Paceibacterota bacterium]